MTFVMVDQLLQEKTSKNKVKVKIKVEGWRSQQKK
jgi:hypothetical protein